MYVCYYPHSCSMLGLVRGNVCINWSRWVVPTNFGPVMVFTSFGINEYDVVGPPSRFERYQRKDLKSMVSPMFPMFCFTVVIHCMHFASPTTSSTNLQYPTVMNTIGMLSILLTLESYRAIAFTFVVMAQCYFSIFWCGLRRMLSRSSVQMRGNNLDRNCSHGEPRSM